MILESLEVGPLGVNCFILGCKETGEGVIVDAGGNAAEIITAVERLGLKIIHLLNTHGHFDHIGANSKICEQFGIDLMIHADDAHMLSRARESAMMYGIRGENSPQPTHFLTDGMIIPVGKLSLKVIHTPGHSPGCCCFYIESEEIILTGDTLFANSIGRSDLPGGSHQQLLDSVRTKLFTLPETVVAYPGHGPETSIGHEKHFNPYF